MNKEIWDWADVKAFIIFARSLEEKGDYSLKEAYFWVTIDSIDAVIVNCIADSLREAYKAGYDDCADEIVNALQP